MLIKEESLSRKFITKGAWIYFFIFLTAPLGYIIRIILTWDLTPSEVGIIYGTISLLSLLGTYTDFWLTESLNYFLPKYILKNDFWRTKYLLLITLWTQIITSTIVSIWLFFGARWIAQNYFHSPEATWVIEILSLFFIWSHILSVITTFLNAIQNIKLQKIIELIRIGTVATGAIILFFSDVWNLYNYAWIWISGIYVGLLTGIILFWRLYIHHFWVTTVIDTTLRKDFIKYSLWTLFSANVATVLHQIDMQFLTYFLWVHDTWIYAIYLSLIGIPFIFIGPLIGFLFPVISEIWSRWDKWKVRDIFRIFSTNLSVIILWIGFLFTVSWVDISRFLFWENFAAAWIALYFITPFLIFNVLMQIHFQILGWLWYVKKRIEILLWTLLVNVIISFICILGYKYGYIPFPNGSSAASFAVGISWILMWYLSYRATREYAYGFDWLFFWKNLGIIILLILWFRYFMNDINSIIWWNGRFYYFPAIGFALCTSLIIFCIINMGHIRTFVLTVKNVRNGNL